MSTQPYMSKSTIQLLDRQLFIECLAEARIPANNSNGESGSMQLLSYISKEAREKLKNRGKQFDLPRLLEWVSCWACDALYSRNLLGYSMRATCHHLEKLFLRCIFNQNHHDFEKLFCRNKMKNHKIRVLWCFSWKEHFSTFESSTKVRKCYLRRRCCLFSLALWCWRQKYIIPFNKGF